jgi:hypothetical protein
LKAGDILEGWRFIEGIYQAIARVFFDMTIELFHCDKSEKIPARNERKDEAKYSRQK